MLCYENLCYENLLINCLIRIGIIDTIFHKCLNYNIVSMNIASRQCLKYRTSYKKKLYRFNKTMCKIIISNRTQKLI